MFDEPTLPVARRGVASRLRPRGADRERSTEQVERGLRWLRQRPLISLERQRPQ